MSDVSIEVISAQTNDNLTGIVLDGVPYLYWLRVYKALGIRKEHAPKIIARLTEGIHYRKFTRDEFALLSRTVDVLATLNSRARAFYFITIEGYNRAIMEIGTGYMNDPIVAAAIDAKKDHIASIYTRYQKGEVLSLAADTTPAIQASPDKDAAYLRFALQANQFIKKMGAARNAANAVTIEMIRENCASDLEPFLAAIPTEQVKNPPDDAVHSRQDVAKILGIPTETLEDKLIEIRWAIRSLKGWLVTPRGSEYLKQDRELGIKGHARFDVTFGLEALHLLKQEFSQRLLTQGYLSSGCSKGHLPPRG